MKSITAHLLTYAILLSVLPTAFAQSLEDDDSEALRSTSSRTAGGPSNDLKQVADLIAEATNAFRQEHELQPVKTNAELQDAARSFARYMAKHDEYGHKADGNRPSDRAEEHGYAYCIVLENIAYQYSSEGFLDKELAGKFEGGWEQSPGHRKNMLDPDVTETGVGIGLSEESGYFYAVQMFGRPKSEQIQFEITNTSAEEVAYELKGKEFPLLPNYTRTHYQCRPTNLVIRLGENQNESLTPEGNDKILIVQKEGGLIVERK